MESFPWTRGGGKSLKATLEALSGFLSERPDAEWQHGSWDPEDAQTNVKRWHFINVSVSLITEAHCTVSGSFFKIYNCLTSGSTPRLLKPYFRSGVTFQTLTTGTLSPVTYYCWRGLNQLSCNINDAVLELTKTSGLLSGSDEKQRGAAKILILFWCFLSQEMWSLMESWCSVLSGAVIKVIIIIFQSNWSLLEWQLGGSNSSHHVPCMNTGRRRRREHANRTKGWRKTKTNGTQKREDIKLELNDGWIKQKTTQNSFLWLWTMCSVTKHAVSESAVGFCSHFEFSDVGD